MFRPGALRNLTWDEVHALSNLEEMCPDGRQPQEMPVPDRPGHYYPARTLESLQRKMAHGRYR